MNRIFVSLCFLLLACGEVVPINGATDADDGTGIDSGIRIDGAPIDICAGPEIALEDMETCFVRMQCEFFVRCLPGFPDVEFCESRLFDFLASLSDGTGSGDGDQPSVLLFETIRKAATLEVANYDGAKAFSCVQSLRDASCKDKGNNPDCELIITGDTAEGLSCFDDFECLPGASCNRDSEFDCNIVGRCEMGLALGANCNGNDCQPGLNCVSSEGVQGGTCQDGTLGSPCNDQRQCNAETYCNGIICVAHLASGAGCANDNQCPGDQLCVNTTCADANTVGDPCNGYCIGNLYCDQDTSNCQPLPGPNASCEKIPAGLGLGRCNDVDFVCGGPSTTCIPRIPVGGPCPAGTTLRCTLGSFCENELGGAPNMPKCLAPQATAEPCNAGKHCSSGFCSPNLAAGGGTCQDYSACWE